MEDSPQSTEVEAGKAKVVRTQRAIPPTAAGFSSFHLHPRHTDGHNMRDSASGERAAGKRDENHAGQT